MEWICLRPLPGLNHWAINVSVVVFAAVPTVMLRSFTGPSMLEL